MFKGITCYYVFSFDYSEVAILLFFERQLFSKQMELMRFKQKSKYQLTTYENASQQHPHY